MKLARMLTMPTSRGASRALPFGGVPRFAALLIAVVVLLPGAALARATPDSFADLAASLLPSVVNVSTTQVLEGNPGIELPQLPPGSPFEEFFKEFMERGQPRQPRRATSLGSGFIIDTDGHVVTNNHVIQDADQVTVILHDETRLEAKVIGRDAKTDLAILKVEPHGKLVPVKFGDSDVVRVGDWILAIGNPFVPSAHPARPDRRWSRQPRRGRPALRGHDGRPDR